MGWKLGCPTPTTTPVMLRTWPQRGLVTLQPPQFTKSLFLFFLAIGSIVRASIRNTRVAKNMASMRFSDLATITVYCKPTLCFYALLCFYSTSKCIQLMQYIQSNPLTVKSTPPQCIKNIYEEALLFSCTFVLTRNL